MAQENMRAVYIANEYLEHIEQKDFPAELSTLQAKINYILRKWLEDNESETK